jgi:hypothetical protein
VTTQAVLIALTRDGGELDVGALARLLALALTRS